jgi:hypothetical protein
MRYVIPILLLVWAGCAASAPPLPAELAAAIPEGANTVELRTSESADDLYEKAKRLLLDRGFAFTHEDDRTWRVDTDAQELGGRTPVRITLRVSPLGSGSQLEAIAHWSSDTSDAAMSGAGPGVSGTIQSWHRAAWGENQQSSGAFGQLALLMDSLPHVEAVYNKK